MKRIRPWIHNAGDQAKYDSSVVDGVRVSPPAVRAARSLVDNLRQISTNLKPPAAALAAGSYRDALRNLESVIQLLGSNRKLLKSCSTDANTLKQYFDAVLADVKKLVSTFPGGVPKSAQAKPQKTDPNDALDQITQCFKTICDDMNRIAEAYNTNASVTKSDDLSNMVNSILAFGRVVTNIRDASNMNDMVYRTNMTDVYYQLVTCDALAGNLAGYLDKLVREA